MTKLCCVLAVCLAFVATDAFAAKNPNKAGKTKKNHQEVFAKLDKNSDGVLTLEEFTAGKVGKKKGGVTPQELFRRLDKNGDGKLTLQEFTHKGGKKKKNQ